MTRDHLSMVLTSAKLGIWASAWMSAFLAGSWHDCACRCGPTSGGWTRPAKPWACGTALRGCQRTWRSSVSHWHCCQCRTASPHCSSPKWWEECFHKHPPWDKKDKKGHERPQQRDGPKLSQTAFNLSCGCNDDVMSQLKQTLLGKIKLYKNHSKCDGWHTHARTHTHTHTHTHTRTHTHTHTHTTHTHSS